MQLHEREVADETPIEAAETFEGDQPERPGADAALAAEPGIDEVAGQVAEPLEVDRRGEAREGRCPMLGEAEPPELDGREPPERVLGDDGRPACTSDRALDGKCSARLDELTAQRPHHRVRHRRAADGPEPDERARGRAEQRVAREPLVEPGRIVVEGEHEPAGRKSVLVGRLEDDAAVAELPGDDDASARERALPYPGPRHVPQAKGAGRRHDVFEHGPTLPGR